MTNEPPEKPDYNLTWLSFTPATPETQARARFEARYGYAPEQVRYVPNAMYMGPVREEDTRGR